MPKIFNKNGVNYIKNHKKQSVFFAFLLIFLFCLLVFNLSDIISSVITNSKSIFVKDIIEVPSYSAYAISLPPVDTEEEANILCKKVESLGGAGVKFERGKLFVLIALYPSLSQAKEIEENLIEIGTDCQIVTLEVPNISKKYAGKDKNFVLSAIKSFKSTYKSLFELSLSFDKGNKSLSQVKNEVKEIYSFVTNLLLDVKKSKVENEFKNAIEEFLKKEKESVYKLIDFSGFSNQNYEKDKGLKLEFSSLIKKVYFESVFFNIDFVKKINNL